MRLTLIGKDPDSNPTGSPTVYRTDRGSWMVQGWVVTAPEALSQMDIPEGETVGDDLEWLQGWCAALRELTGAGKSVRRARIVSEPLSDYQRWSYSIAQAMVGAGEDIRWVPRRLVSSVAIPGNDFYLFDGQLAVFLLYTGNGLNAGMLASRDTADVQLCRDSFDAVWDLAIPHRDYQPV
jgi:hypothetical protein